MMNHLSIKGIPHSQAMTKEIPQSIPELNEEQAYPNNFYEKTSTPIESMLNSIPLPQKMNQFMEPTLSHNPEFYQVYNAPKPQMNMSNNINNFLMKNPTNSNQIKKKQKVPIGMRNDGNFYNQSQPQPPMNEMDPYLMMGMNNPNRYNMNISNSSNYFLNQQKPMMNPMNMNPYQPDNFSQFKNPYSLPQIQGYPMNIQNMQMFNVYMNKSNNQNNRKNYIHNTNSSNQKGRGNHNNQINQPNSFMKRPQIYEVQTFDEIYGSIPEVCKDHYGSKIFQKIYEEGTDEQKEKIMNKIIPEVYSLSKDVFGNYVVQHLLEIVSEHKKKLMINQLYNKIKELTLHMYGCRVIQKAIDVADVDDVRRHLVELQGDLIKCVQDQNGNHVIQKLIEKLPQGEHGEIINIIKGRVYQLSIHQYGCRVIQRIFEYCTQKEKNIVLQEIYERINELCMDQYGNYVIQNIVEKIKDNGKVFEALKGRVYEYSKHKFASNVIEKCLSVGTREQTNLLVQEIIEFDNRNNEVLFTLVKDKYGNYVVQKMIEVAELKAKEILVKKINNSQALKKRDGFSKHVISLIEKMGLASLLDQNSGGPQTMNMNNYQFNKMK